MAKSNQRGRNNNPEGHNQYSGGWMDTAKEKPFTTAAAAAAAVGAGVFLWSRRNQISDQISNLSGQIHDWADDMRSGSSSRELALTEGPNESSAIEASRATKRRTATSGSRSSTGRSGGSTARTSRGQSPGNGQSFGAGAETFNS